MRTTMKVLSQNPTSDRSSARLKTLRKNSYQNWVIWCAGIILSILPLLFRQIARSFASDGHVYWFFDIFNDPGIIMVSVSMGVAAFFEFLTKSDKRKMAVINGIILLILIILDEGLYAVIITSTEFGYNTSSWIMIASNMALLIAMFFFGSKLIIPEKRFLPWN